MDKNLLHVNLDEIGIVIDLINAISGKDFECSFNNFDLTIELTNFFYSEYLNRKNKLPYQLNLIDELRANENAHSRILYKLLQYKNENNYPFWELFIKHVGFDILEVGRPEFFVERDRIDLLVRDKHKQYAVVIENKIHGAVDQPGQIYRYVDKTHLAGFNIDSIYVIYITKEGGSPSEESLPKELHESLNKRYQEISFRYNILPWLEEKVLPTCRYNDNILISALQQYIDHLQGLFNARQIERDMNKELLTLFEKKLELDNDKNKNIEKLKNTIEKLNTTKMYLDDLLKLQWFKYWADNINKDFSGQSYEIFILYEDLNNYPKVGVTFNLRNTKFSVLIEVNGSKVYFGIGIHNATDEIDINVMNEVKDFISEPDYKSNLWWYGYKYTSFENAYNGFKDLTEKIIAHKNVRTL